MNKNKSKIIKVSDVELTIDTTDKPNELGKLLYFVFGACLGMLMAYVIILIILST